MAKIPGRLRPLTGKQRRLFHWLATSGAVATLAAVLAAASGSLLLARPAAAGAEIPAHATSFADMVERVKPAVISVSVKFAPPKSTRSGEAPESSLDRFLRRYGAPNGGSSSPPRRPTLTGQGSGFFISPDGFAVTNFHVVDKADYVGVTTDDGRVLTATVIGADQRSDIAVIKVDGGDFPFVRFADASPRVGDWVIAVGNPFGLGGTVTAGIVSARGRALGTGAYDDLIQIDAAVNRGNSGGPTFDIEGNVIGVNTAIVSPTGGSVGIAFAIPAEDIKGVINQLRDKGKVIRGWIGVKMQDVNRDLAEELGLATTRGALVAEPETNGPAAKAGLAPGDVITAIEDKPVADFREAARTVSGLPPAPPPNSQSRATANRPRSPSSSAPCRRSTRRAPVRLHRSRRARAFPSSARASHRRRVAAGQSLPISNPAGSPQIKVCGSATSSSKRPDRRSATPATFAVPSRLPRSPVGAPCCCGCDRPKGLNSSPFRSGGSQDGFSTTRSP